VQASSPANPTLSGYELLVFVTGGIAAYKTAALVSALVQQGGGVTVAMTRNARRFVGSVTFEALTGRPVATSMWRRRPAADIQHLTLSETADLIVVAPATANILAKLAGGIADDLVSTLLLGADCPVMLAPAMNARMWQHPATGRNVTWLRENGYTLIGPEEGWQACRAVGPGRMSEPETLLVEIQQRLLTAPPRGRG
jgi:phosphopantothenoylcysteine decarboxylase/phosphopantothenate--cysteine ligase